MFGPHSNNVVDEHVITLKQTGWPMAYLFDILEPYFSLPKKKQIVFPHRLAPEKQLDIFKDLAASMPQYEWVVCQEKTLTKDQYHQILGESAIVFSANLQETYGISCIEGLICGAIPLVPDRLSYSEMYLPTFKYPSIWTTDFDNYKLYKNHMMFLIESTMEGVGTPTSMTFIDKQIEHLRKYVYADNLINALIKEC
jgi:glycosyltransferase involved in cell wall biosynthesis